MDYYYEDSFFGSFAGAPPLFGIVFVVIFCIVVGGIVYNIVRGLAQWGKNNQSPVLSVNAEIVNMRQDVRHHMDSNSSHSYTDYYATFEVESGDRIEFSIRSSEYGKLAIGDLGRLTFQGTRFQGFERV